jgi:hypothetical protein
MLANGLRRRAQHALEIGERIGRSLTSGSKQRGTVLSYRVGLVSWVWPVKKKEFIFFQNNF